MIKKTTKGLTLLEVIIALAVAAIMAVGVVSSMITAIRAQNISTQLTKAQNISQQIMEEIRSYPFSLLQDKSVEGILQWPQDIESLDGQEEQEMGNLSVNFTIVYPHNGNIHEAKVNVWAIYEQQEIYRIASIFAKRDYEK